MKKYRQRINKEIKNKRIDKYLGSIDDIPSRSFAQKLIKNKKVNVNNKIVNKSYLLEKGDLVEFEMPEPEFVAVEPENIPIKIHYQDKDIAVIEKPAGMVTHPSHGHWSGTLVNALIYSLKDLSSIGGVIRPGIVHRLDKDTSGLLIVAKNDESHISLSRAIKERRVKRRYIALVHGHMKEETGSVDMPIGRSFKDRKKMSTNMDGKKALTYFKVEERFKAYDLLEVTLKTGRTHQIRVHLKAIGHPIIGDHLYHTESKKIKRQALHAKGLEFEYDGKPFSFNADLPEDMAKLLNAPEIKPL